VEEDRDFERFCENLDGLKGQGPLYKSRHGLTDRIMTAVRQERKQTARRKLRDFFGPFAVASAVAVLWFYFHVTPVLALPSLPISGV
jgi:hypothetical protein